MINLLPTDQKQNNSYGLRNRVLLRWATATVIGLVGIWAIIGFGFYQLNQSISAQNQQIKSTEQRLKEQDIEGVRAQTEEIDNSIKLALNVLEKKILLSKLIQRIGAVIPENAILLGIGLEDIEGGINLSARATDYESATQVQVNISDPLNNVFEQADILDVACITPDEASTDILVKTYPCTVSLRALFGDNSPFLFVNQTTEPEGEIDE